MSNDDQAAVRAVIQQWLEASNRGDHDAALALMADDVEFLVCGSPPFGKQRFAETAKQMAGVKMSARSEIRDLEVAGDWAWVRSQLTVEMTPPGGETRRREGAVLSVLRKQDGRWVFFRDANFLQ